MYISDLEATLVLCKEFFDFPEKIKELCYLHKLLPSTRLEFLRQKGPLQVHLSLIQFASDLIQEKHPEDLVAYNKELFDSAQKVDNAVKNLFSKKTTPQEFCVLYAEFLEELIAEMGQKVLITDVTH